MNTENIPTAQWEAVFPGVLRMTDRHKKHPVWTFSGENSADSAKTVIDSPPGRYLRFEAELAVHHPEPGTCDVYRIRLSQPGSVRKNTVSAPVISPVRPVRKIVLEPFYEADPAHPLEICIERANRDPRNTCRAPSCLLSLQIAALRPPVENRTVQSPPGYNSWPFIQTLGSRLVCVYSRGSAHTIDEPARGVYARTSDDGGASWSAETQVCNSPDSGDVPTGKGLDQNGSMLLWVRSAGKSWHHDLFRTGDGIHFLPVARLRPDPMPMQITDIFAVPGVGLMSLWFAGFYTEDREHSWGTLTSEDNGGTWRQTVVEAGLGKQDWPTEPSAVYLGNGRILAVARTEGEADDTGRAQFQLESHDYGATWKRTRTNITDVQGSTPSLILDRGRIYNYYFQRKTGQLKCRTAGRSVWGRPLDWSAPEIIALASKAWQHAGNVNAVLHGDTHELAFYTGNESATEVVLKTIRRPPGKKKKEIFQIVPCKKIDHTI